MMKCIRLLCRIQCRRGFSSASKIDSSVSTQSCSKVEPAERIPLKKNIEDIFNEKKKEIAVIEQSTGLFGNTTLSSPEAFEAELVNVVTRCNIIVQQIHEDKEPGEHTIHLLDEIVESISTLTDLAAFIATSHSEPKFRSAARAMSSKAEKYTDFLNANPELYKSLKTAVNNTDLDSETKEVAKRLLIDFKQSGAHLSKQKQSEILCLQNDLALTGVEFIKSAYRPATLPLKSCPDVLLGLPLKNDKIVLDNWYDQNTQDSLREQAWKHYYKYDKKRESLLHNILDQRHALAKSTGYNNYAERALQGSMAESPEVVGEFVDELKKQVNSLAREELINIELWKRDESRYFHDEMTVFPWDHKFYCQDARTHYINLHTKMRLPHVSWEDFLSVGTVMEQIGVMFGDMFGVSLVPEVPYKGEVWSDEVIKLAVEHETQGLIGFIYCDFYDSAKGSSPPSHHLIQSNAKGRVPIVVVKCRYTASNGYRPAHLPLPTLDRLFAELGTAIHSLFSSTNFYQSSSSYTSPDVKSVSAELLKQIGRHPGILHQVCRHHTRKRWLNQIDPAKLLTQSLAYNIYTATELEQQLLYTAMDHEVHTEWANRGSNSSTDIYAQLTEEYTHMPYVEGTAEHLRMTSLFNQGGTYYSNLWCKAIATIIFEEIFKGDPFSRPGGEYFREHFLKHGASCNPRELVENLTGTKLTPARLATALTKPIELSKSFEQGWLDEKGVRGVSPVKVIDVPHELSTSPLLYRLADTHPQLLDDQGQFKEKVFEEDRARLQGIAACGGEGLLDRVASKHPHLLNKQGQLRDNLFGKDLDKLEKLSKLEHTPYSKIKRGIKRLKGVQEEGPKKISD